MSETAQQYIQRITGHVEGKKASGGAGRHRKETRAPDQRRAHKQIAQASRLLNKWSVSEIVAHLADTEIVGGFRMRFISGCSGISDCGLRSGCLGQELAL